MEQRNMIDRAQALISEISELPTIPEVATRVLHMLNDPDVEPEELAELILADQVMAARVVKIVNSPIYRPRQEISSVKRALIYLGLRQIREIILTCYIMHAFDGKDGVYDIKTFWKHSFGVGIVSRIIAQRIRYPDSEKAYIVGLIHDIGEVFLSYYFREEFGRVVKALDERPNVRMRDLEKELIGTSHCEIGHWLAHKWNFPPEYRDVIVFHHDPAEATIDRTLAAIVNLADLFCSVRQMGYGGNEWVSFNLANEKAWEILLSYASGLPDLDVERFCFELDERAQEVEELVLSIFDANVLE
jgi:putative nucleotidyltransferase with HDIG domain